MTLTEVVVSAVILGISTQVSLQGWSRTSQVTAASNRTDQQVRLLEQWLLVSRRALSSAPVVDTDCRWDPEAVRDVLEALPKNAHLGTSWHFEPSVDGLWVAVGLIDPDAAIPFNRIQMLTPAGLGHCPWEATDEL